MAAQQGCIVAQSKTSVMIINRYLMRTIHLGTFTVLLALVGLGLFFVFIGELKDLGKGAYDFFQVTKFVALSFPGKAVEFMPIAVLLGTILSLGSLASNSEIIAMQASGVSMARLIASVLQAAVVLALLSFLLAEWVVPASESSARSVKNLVRGASTALFVKKGLWIKDESRILHIDKLLPDGIARDIEVFQLGPQGKVVSITRIGHAIPVAQGWELQQVEKSIIGDNSVDTVSHDRLIYDGKLSPQLLGVLMIEPQQMSSADLYAYLNFLDENKLGAKVEQLIFWQKIFSPLVIVIMCLLAFPFVLGAQRQGNTGQRLMIGILLGLAFVVVDRLVTQLAVNYGVNAVLAALIPGLIFLAVAIYLLIRLQSHGASS
jgi:lipopolysaccharide export system permease protein